MSYSQSTLRGSRVVAGATTAPAATVSTTITQTRAQSLSGATLRLRAESPTQGTTDQSRNERRVQWAEDVVNNEGMGKKSSKVCCIYHKPRPVGESSDEDSEDSSSDDDSDFGDDDGAARPSDRSKRSDHKHGHGPNHNHDHKCTSPDSSQDPKTKRKINAYERIPKNT